MNKYGVLWTKTAEQDLENIIDYIARDGWIVRLKSCARFGVRVGPD